MREKELRLALVCYGGVSLAVYMHGITKEIWKLARASRAFTAGEPPGQGVERVYYDLLALIERRGETTLRVLPDIIAGASAGGLNGVFLAQAIASGQSLEAITELWLGSADIEALTDPEAAPRGRFTKLWAVPIAWMAAGRNEAIEAIEDDAVREEVRAKLSHFVRSRWFEPPFGGERFSGLILDALDAMASGPADPRLLPEDQPLDLFVTVTDFTGHPERLTLHSPPEVVETEHRLVIRFTDNGVGLGHAAELTFAGRATSSFPGAFPPFQVGELDGLLAARGRRWPGRRRFLARVLPRRHAEGRIEQAALIDGSVLANAPFRPAIEALPARPARRQVDRRFVYIDPAPGHKLSLTRGGGAPGFFQTILGALSELPRKQPIRDNLEAIGERSQRIERLRAIVDAIRPDVEAEVSALFGHDELNEAPSAARLAAWRARAQQAAATRAGYSYAAYEHLKVEGVTDWASRLLHTRGRAPGKIARDAVREAMLGEFVRSGDAATLLRRFDLRFRARRLRLLARRLGELEADGSARELADVRAAIYESIAAYRELDQPAALATPRGTKAMRAAVRSLGESLALATLDTITDDRVADALAGARPETRRALLLTYLGFPFYDVATLPLLQGEGLDEFDPIRVDRIAPDDAVAIRRGGADTTLKGIEFNNFGAFFSRAWRENDYLWGRLHGAERLIDITLSTLPGARAPRRARTLALKRAAFRAILDEEAPRLTTAAALIEQLRREIG